VGSRTQKSWRRSRRRTLGTNGIALGVSGGATVGEHDAAGAAIARLQARLAAAREDPPQEMPFTMPDAWSVSLFAGLYRRYDLRPYCYPRQPHSTIMVRASRRFFDAVVWSSTQSSGRNLVNCMRCCSGI